MSLRPGRARSSAGKDLRIEVRGRYALGPSCRSPRRSSIAFGLSLGPGRTLLQQTAPGLLWLAMLFASVLSFRRAFEAEGEDGALEGLLLAPDRQGGGVPGQGRRRSPSSCWCWRLVVVLLVSALFGLSLGGDAWCWLAAFVLGTIGLAAVGSLFGVLAESPRAREAVFPLLVLPLATPVLLAGVRATALAIAGPGGEAGSWLGLLVAFDVVFVAAGTLVFEHLHGGLTWPMQHRASASMGKVTARRGERVLGWCVARRRWPRARSCRSSSRRPTPSRATCSG